MDETTKVPHIGAAKIITVLSVIGVIVIGYVVAYSVYYHRAKTQEDDYFQYLSACTEKAKKTNYVCQVSNSPSIGHGFLWLPKYNGLHLTTKDL